MANEYGQYMDSRDGGTETKHSGCCIRFESEWPYPKIHVNETHISVGVKSVTVNNRGELEFSHDNGPIVSMHADPDESLTARGITAGLSGGGGKTICRLFVPDSATTVRQLDLSTASDWAIVRGPYCNLWMSWVNVVSR